MRLETHDVRICGGQTRCIILAQTERQVISEALQTGLTSVDALTPMGRGQSMLVMGETGLGQSAMALDAVSTQADTGKAIRASNAVGLN